MSESNAPESVSEENKESKECPAKHVSTTNPQ